jgi:photosystem II stability/assembly factor-like uncharacterized protein
MKVRWEGWAVILFTVFLCVAALWYFKDIIFLMREAPKQEKVRTFHDNFLNIASADTLNLWAVGYNGVILHTSDAGEKWEYQNSGVKVALAGVDFVSTAKGWAVGRFGTIISTQDGGKTWKKQGETLTRTIRESPRGTPDGNNKVFQSSALFKPGTMNVYQNGVKLEPKKDFREIEGMPEIHAIVAPSSGAELWLEYQRDYSDVFLSGISFTDESNGWVVGTNGTILHTADGGNTWELQDSGLLDPNKNFEMVMAEDIALNRVYFVDPEYGWACGEWGVILRTIDGGKTWELSDTGVDKTLFDVDFVNRSLGIAVGVDGIVIRTTDGGSSWKTLTTAFEGNHLFAITFRKYGDRQDDPFALGRGAFIYSTLFEAPTLPGDYWLPIPHMAVERKFVWFNDITFTSETDGWIVGEKGIIMRSKDSGSSWEVVDYQ